MKYGTGWHYTSDELEEQRKSYYRIGYNAGYEQAVRDIKGDDYVDAVKEYNESISDDVFSEYVKRTNEESKEDYINKG